MHSPITSASTTELHFWNFCFLFNRLYFRWPTQNHILRNDDRRKHGLLSDATLGAQHVIHLIKKGKSHFYYDLNGPRSWSITLASHAITSIFSDSSSHKLHRLHYSSFQDVVLTVCTGRESAWTVRRKTSLGYLNHCNCWNLIQISQTSLTFPFLYFLVLIRFDMFISGYYQGTSHDLHILSEEHTVPTPQEQL